MNFKGSLLVTFEVISQHLLEGTRKGSKCIIAGVRAVDSILRDVG